MAAALAAACLGGRLELPVRASELEEDHRLSMEFVTPHTKWAQPYAQGKTRVLVFINGGTEKLGTLARETIELKQRFDLDAAAVYTILPFRAKERWLHGEAGVERLLELLDQPWDCYVLYQIPLELVPDEGRAKLLAAVAAGSGLVMVGTDEQHVLKPGNLLESLPDFLAHGTPFTGLPFVWESVLKGLEPGQATSAEAARRMMSTYDIENGRGVRLIARPDLGGQSVSRGSGGGPSSVDGVCHAPHQVGPTLCRGQDACAGVYRWRRHKTLGRAIRDPATRDH